jgi:pimeloyl-ACP methyl ester carboxylesterase
MPIARVNGVDIYYEEAGRGFPLVWSHEFGGDYRSWEPQIRHFARGYRVIVYNHRGYPPSEVPKEAERYTQDALIADLHGLLRFLGIRQAHIGGCSMGANVALNFGLAHPEMARSLIVVGAGAGSVNRDVFLARQRDSADALEREGMGALVRNLSQTPARRAFREKDPRGWDEFLRYVSEHSPTACACLIRGVIMRRPTVAELESRLRGLQVPTLIMVGDEDEPCVEPSFMMRRLIPNSGLLVVPGTGHTVNIEEPVLFNLHVADFLARVERVSAPQA